MIYVKITIYQGLLAYKVVYYRNKITVEQSVRWRWYFDYLVALIKVKYPKNKVVLEIGQQTLLQGNEYVEKKRKSLLSSKKTQLKRLLTTEYVDDLFQSSKIKIDDKIEKLKKEIQSLENEEFNYYIPETYINEVKNLLKHHPCISAKKQPTK